MPKGTDEYEKGTEVYEKGTAVREKDTQVYEKGTEVREKGTEVYVNSRSCKNFEVVSETSIEYGLLGSGAVYVRTLENKQQRFEGICCLHLQGKTYSDNGGIIVLQNVMPVYRITLHPYDRKRQCWMTCFSFSFKCVVFLTFIYSYVAW
jgi:hypothetical protein